MSKKIQKVILWVAIIAILVLGISALGHSKRSADTATTNPYMNDTSALVETTNPNAQPEGKKMAFSQFVKQGGSYKCEVKQAMSDMENTGTVYISGGNMSGDFTTIAEGKTMQMSTLMRDGYSYTWGSMMPGMGFKVKVAASNDTSTDTNTSGTYSWNADQIGDYNCVAWTPDQSKFTLPANITFKDMSSMQAQ